MLNDCSSREAARGFQASINHGLILLISVLVPMATLRASDSSNQPNILFVLADDLGIGDLQCYGNPFVETPTINSLAREGVLLTDHYAPAPLCSPARAGYLTGRFNHRTGAIDVPSNRGLDRIALSEKTFGDYFRHAGYATALIGKWHNGLYCRDHLPHQRGFDLFYGFPNGGQDYWKWNLLRNDAAVPHDGRYLSDALNDEAARFIRDCSSNEKTFACFLAHHAPHVPFQAPKTLIEKYRKRLGSDGSENVATIYAMIEAMDIGLAGVLQTIKDEGLWEQTIIVFTSDNGAHFGNVEGSSTERYHASYSGNKGDVGEQGIRVPAIVSWPGHIPGGRVISTPVHGCDWLPTLFSTTTNGAAVKHDGLSDADGQKQTSDEFLADTKPLDGTNVMPLLMGEAQPSLQSRALPFQKNRYRPATHSDAAIRRSQWKLVWPGAPVTMKKDAARDNPSYLRGLVHPHWEMPLDRELGPVPKFREEKPRLYDLAADPAERYDLADKHPVLVSELVNLYDRWFVDVMKDWQRSRKSILDHDRAYWKDRAAPDPAALFEDFWQWKHAPAGTDPRNADPLQVFTGFWSIDDARE